MRHRRWLLWGVALVAVGFMSGQLAARVFHGLQAGRVDPLAGWIEERDGLARALMAALTEGEDEEITGAAMRLLEVDPIDGPARRIVRLASGSGPRLSDRGSGEASVAGVGGGWGDAGAVPPLEPGPELLSSPEEIESLMAARFGGDAEFLQLHLRDGRTLRAAEQLRSRGRRSWADDLMGIEARLREAGSWLLRSRLEQAHEKWKEASRLEAGLFGESVRSASIREMGVTLAERWSARAEQSLARGQLREASTAWKHAREAHPAQAEAAEGAKRIEALAAELLAGNARCADLQEILASTSRTSAAHRKASARAGGCDAF